MRAKTTDARSLGARSAGVARHAPWWQGGWKQMRGANQRDVLLFPSNFLMILLIRPTSHSRRPSTPRKFGEASVPRPPPVRCRASSALQRVPAVSALALYQDFRKFEEKSPVGSRLRKIFENLQWGGKNILRFRGYILDALAALTAKPVSRSSCQRPASAGWCGTPPCSVS